MKTWLTKMNGVEFKVMRLQEGQTEVSELMDGPEMVDGYLRKMLPNSVRYNPDVENFIIMFLSARKRVIGFEVISNGILDTLLVHPREVFKPAILMMASSICLAHNHPSGDPTPSEADIKMTRDLIKASQFLKIEIVDHVIMGTATLDRPKAFSSLRELGYFYS